MTKSRAHPGAVASVAAQTQSGVRSPASVTCGRLPVPRLAALEPRMCQRSAMTGFESADGRCLTVVPGFREVVLSLRPSGTPGAGWTQADYDRVAARRVRSARGRLRHARDALGVPGPIQALEIGCGAGVESVVAAVDGLGTITAVDRAPALLDPGERGERASRLVASALRAMGAAHDVERVLDVLSLRFAAMDADALDLPDASVDFVSSRAALEHVQPLASVLCELGRVVRAGGVAQHMIDPFFWVKGCHAGGLIDLPWAHARLSSDDFARAAVEIHGERRGARRAGFLGTLNALGLDAWRVALTDGGRWELLSWRAQASPMAARLLADHPEVSATTLPSVTRADLVTQSVTVVLRRLPT